MRFRLVLWSLSLLTSFFLFLNSISFLWMHISGFDFLVFSSYSLEIVKIVPLELLLAQTGFFLFAVIYSSWMIIVTRRCLNEQGKD